MLILIKSYDSFHNIINFFSIVLFNYIFFCFLSPPSSLLFSYSNIQNLVSAISFIKIEYNEEKNNPLRNFHYSPLFLITVGPLTIESGCLWRSERCDEQPVTSLFVGTSTSSCVSPFSRPSRPTFSYAFSIAILKL